MEKEIKELTLYDKNKIIEGVTILLKYYNISKTKKEVIKAVHLLIDKVRYNDTDYITLESDFIEEILFIQNDDNTRAINNDIFHLLVSLGADLQDVSFDNVHISGYHFGAFKNMEINIQEIPNSNISKTSLKGVKVNGTLDGANIVGTDFTGYIGDLVLNPQLIQDKNLYQTNLNGITVNGSFDGVDIRRTKTAGFKGEIIINPQTIQNKELFCIDLNKVKLVGNFDEKNETYTEPCFDGCRIYDTSFKGCIGNVIIPIDKLPFGAQFCNFTGIKVTGIKDNFSIKHSYYEDETGEKIFLSSDEVKNNITSGEKHENTPKTKVRKNKFVDKIRGASKK